MDRFLSRLTIYPDYCLSCRFDNSSVGNKRLKKAKTLPLRNQSVIQ